MLEALEKIKSAEEQNERKKELLLAELSSYESTKKQLLQKKRDELKKDFSSTLAIRERTLAEELETEERELTSRAEVAIKKMEDNYLEKRNKRFKKLLKG